MPEKIYIAKRGNSCTIFVDPTTSTPLPLTGPEDQPVGGLPVSCNIRNWKESLARAGVRGIYDPVFLEDKKPEPKAVVRTKAVVEETNKILEKKNQKLENNSDIIKIDLEKFSDKKLVTDKFDKMLLEFKIILGKYGVATGKTKTNLKVEINAVANFILAVAPDLEIDLNLLKESYQAPRFDIDG